MEPSRPPPQKRKSLPEYRARCCFSADRIPFTDHSQHYLIDPAVLSKDVDTGEHSVTAIESNGQLTALSSIQRGMAESGTDYVYLMRQSGKPTVFLISRAGTVEQRLKLEAPADAIVSSLKVGPGEVLVEYTRRQMDKNSNAVQYFYVYGTEDGEILSTLTVSPEVHGIFTCTDWRGGFGFLAITDDRGSVLVQGKSR